jgi:hypothetical protein
MVGRHRNQVRLKSLGCKKVGVAGGPRASAQIPPSRFRAGGWFVRGSAGESPERQGQRDPSQPSRGEQRKESGQQGFKKPVAQRQQ